MAVPCMLQELHALLSVSFLMERLACPSTALLISPMAPKGHKKVKRSSLTGSWQRWQRQTTRGQGSSPLQQRRAAIASCYK